MNNIDKREDEEKVDFQEKSKAEKIFSSQSYGEIVMELEHNQIERIESEIQEKFANDLMMHALKVRMDASGIIESQPQQELEEKMSDDELEMEKIKGLE